MSSPGDKTLHQRILEDIEGKILSGIWAPGTRIPYEVDLATQYDCSRMTVNKVLTHLANAGLIERRRKAGTYVSQPRAQSAVLEIHDIRSEVESLNLAYSYELKQREIRRPKAAERAFLGKAERIVSLVSLHGAGGRPFCLEERLINLSAVPDAEHADFSATSPGQWLLKQVPWSAAEHSIRAEGASEEAARHLGLEPGTPCLVIGRRTFSEREAITHVRLTYPGDRHELTAHFSPADSGQKVS